MIRASYDPKRDVFDVYYDDLDIVKLEQARDEYISCAIGRTNNGDIYFLTIFDASRLTLEAWRASDIRGSLPPSLSADVDAWCARPTVRAGLVEGSA